MAATKFYNLLTLLSLAALACNFSAQPVNALATGDLHHGARGHGHAALAKKARRSASNTKRCRQRPSSIAASSAKATSPASTAVAASSAVSSSAVSSSVEASSAPAPPKSTKVETSTSTYVAPKPTSSSEAPPPPPPATTSKAAPPPPATTSKAAPPPQTTAQAPPPPKPTSNPAPSGGGGKVGLAWANGNSDPSIANFVTPHVKYVYTWSPYCPDDTKKLGLTCIPMLWGPNQVDDFQKLVVEGYSNIVASFNEPNQAGQSNLDPGYAASLHKQHIDPLKNKGYKIVTPATSSAPNGLPWVQNFMKACNDCQFDYVAVHWYDVTFDAFKTYLELWHNTFNLPIMVTEFADQNFNGGAQATSDEVWAFWSQAIKYMEAQPWIISYFGFGVMHDMQGVNGLNQLMGSNNYPNALGENYINVSW